MRRKLLELLILPYEKKMDGKATTPTGWVFKGGTPSPILVKDCAEKGLTVPRERQSVVEKRQGGVCQRLDIEQEAIPGCVRPDLVGRAALTPPGAGARLKGKRRPGFGRGRAENKDPGSGDAGAGGVEGHIRIEMHNGGA